MAEEEGLADIPFPQVKFISLLPFAPPVPVIEFPSPEKVEQAVYQLLSLKSAPEIVQFLKGSRG